MAHKVSNNAESEAPKLFSSDDNNRSARSCCFGHILLVHETAPIKLINCQPLISCWSCFNVVDIFYSTNY